jgi:hypothetical protein
VRVEQLVDGMNKLMAHQPADEQDGGRAADELLDPDATVQSLREAVQKRVDDRISGWRGSLEVLHKVTPIVLKGDRIRPLKSQHRV